MRLGPPILTAISISGILCLGRSHGPHAEGPEPAAGVETSDWRGYVKQSFTVAGRPCFLVAPKVAAPGNPWVWRTSFPDYHAEVDEELLRNGFHVAHVDVLAMLGADAALDIMDEFYDVLRRRWSLAAQPALEAVSRGGFHAYRYAARHPDRIACIYADVPVMDLESWPLGRESAAQELQSAMRFYGFDSIEELLAFRGNPVDLMDVMARAAVPIRHVVCLEDSVVPPEQNTFEASRRLKELGGEMDIVIVPESDQAEGHHFDLPEAFESAQFIMRHADVRPAEVEYFDLRDGLSNSMRAFEKTGRGRIAFLGGSITENGGWRDELMRYFRLRFPGVEFDFIAAGIASVGSNGHAFRLERDVLMRGCVDLVFVEAAVNDAGNIPDKPHVMLRAMEGVVRHLRKANPMTDIVHMHFAAAGHLGAYHGGTEPLTIAQHEKVAMRYGCVSLDLARETADRIAAGQFTWESGFNANVHPPPFGQRVYSNSMTRMLDFAWDAAGDLAPHPLPDPVDLHCYDDGRFGCLEDLTLGKGFTFVPSWQPESGGTRRGFVEVPALVASEAGAEFSYAFTGTAVGLFLAAGPDTCVLEFRIDAGEATRVDTYTPWSKSLHLPWPIIIADGLTPGEHVLSVRTTDAAPDRTALHVIHLLLN